MKKILFLLLLSIATYGQIVPTGQEQDFDYGIKNTASQLDDNGAFITVQDATGVQGKSTSSVWAKKIYVDNADATKSFLSTGLIKNGLVTTNADPTKFNITAGIGIITNFDNPDNPTSTIVSFPAFTGITPTYLTTGNITYVAINISSAVVMQATAFTAEQRRDLIVLGAVIHSNLTTINLVNNISAPTNSGVNQLHDLYEFIGALNLTGNKYTANNGANLSLDKTAGIIGKLGVNFANNWKDPNRLTIGQQTLLTFRYRTQNGTESTDLTVLNPAVYDLNNVLTSVPSNRFSIQTVTLFQTGATRIQYGQQTYATLPEAEVAILTRSYVIEPNIAANGIARAYIILKNTATSLLNTNDTKIIEAQKFGGAASGGTAVTDAAVIAALGFTPENVANKSDSYTASSSTTYASTKALVDGLGTKQNTLTNPISGTGTTNTIPKFTASGTVGASRLFDDGTFLGINNATPIRGIHLKSNTSTGGLFIEHSTVFSGNILEVKSNLNGAVFSVDYGGIVNVGNNFNVTGRTAVSSTPQFSYFEGNGSNGFRIYGAAGIDFKTIDNADALHVNQTGRVLINTLTGDGVNFLQVNGSTKTTALTLSTDPTTSAGTYDILTRNTSTGVVEKVAALGFTPENVANKSDSYTASSSTTYASTKALVDGLGTKENPSGTFNVINNGFYNAFPGCVKMSNGNLICVYRKGTSHALDKGDIMKIISYDNGRSWSTESLVFSHATLDVRDPSITLLANNNLLVTYFTYNISTLRYSTYVKISTDNGATWGGEISVGGFNYDSGVSSPAIQLGNGDLLLSIYGTDTGDIYTSNKVVKSINNGTSWTTLSTLANGQSLTNNYSEPSLVLLSNGNILALNRNETDNNLHSAISTNSAITWGALSIAKPGISRASLLRMDNNNVLMTYRSYDNTSIASWKPAICTISSDGTVFGEENLFDLKSNTLDVYSSIVKISQGRYGIAYCLEFSGTRADLFFRYINEIELVKDVSIVQGISSYDNSYFKKSLYIKEDLKANGYAIALGFKTPDGTSSQFLKANGSVDNGAFAPISGSVNYIHNQFSSAQTGNFWINGLTRFNNTLDIDRTGASGDFVTFKHPTKNWSIYMDSGGFYIKNLTDMNYPLNILPTGGAIFLSTVTATSFNGSATLTGTPTAPTAALGTNTTQIATTAFVQAANTGDAKLSANNTFTSNNTFNNVISTLGLSIDNGGSNNGISMINNGGVIGLSISSTDSAKGIVLNNATSATGAPFTIRKNSVNKLTMTDDGGVQVGAPIRLKNYTVSTLPTGVQGDTAYVTDATAPTYLGTLTGGGTVVCPVFYNGTSWVSH